MSLLRLLPALALLPLIAACDSPLASLSPEEEAFDIPPAAVDVAATAPSATAYFAGGCFWGVQAVFQHLEGVDNAVSGYLGGPGDMANYGSVTTGQTGHAETVAVVYDPSVISYGKLLEVYFSVAHDPTQLNYQGPDRGTQYRSALFPVDAEQERVARAYIAQLGQSGAYTAPIVTTIEPMSGFYPAEDYHQDYLTNNPLSPYIVLWDLPKLASLKQRYPDLYREDPMLVAEAPDPAVATAG